MARRNYISLAALSAAGLLWGLTVPLSKVSLVWLGPAWLTAVRFALSAPLLALVGRRGLREALVPRVAISGAVGFGAVIMLQNAGVERTSVSHAAIILGAVPVVVGLIAAASGQARARPRAWGGFAVALGGIALIAGAGGGGATASGDLLVLASALLSAAFIVAQPRLLKGQAPTSVTAVQFTAGTMVAIPIAVLTTGAPPAPANAGPVLAVAALSLAGTLLPFWLFAFGQARVTADVAGAFVNLEPLVGAAIGWLAFGEAAATQQFAGIAAVLAGLVLSTMPAKRAADDAHVTLPRGESHSAGRSAGRGRAFARRRSCPRAQVRSARDRADDPRAGQRTPEAAVVGCPAVVAHEKVITGRNHDRLR